MNEFWKEQIIEGLKKRYPERVILPETITGNNDTKKEGVIVRKPEAEVAPVIYLEDSIDRLIAGEELEAILDELVALIDQDVNLSAGNFFDFEKVKEKIFFRVINAGKNEELLKSVPYRKFLDLAVTFRVVCMVNDNVKGSTIINYRTLHQWGISEDELYEIAYNNTFSQPLNAVPISEIIKNKLCDSEADIPQDVDKLLPIYVFGHNSDSGAACILQKDLLRKLAQKHQKDLIVLPSSIHEIMVVAKERECPVSVFRDMIRGVNHSVAPVSDVLSDHVYLYNREKDELMDLCVQVGKLQS